MTRVENSSRQVCRLVLCAFAVAVCALTTGCPPPSGGNGNDNDTGNPLPDCTVANAACDDDDPCTTEDTCVDGECVGTAIEGCIACDADDDCDDDNTCTDDSCSDGVCTFADNTDACDDGDGCTSGDVCANGTCTGSPIEDCTSCTVNSDCSDGNPCTSNVCNDEGVCENPFNTAPCNDGDPCTANDFCTDGVCEGALIDGCATCVAAADCDDGNDCTDDTCVEGFCQHPPNFQSCDDGDVCTINDQCFSGECSGVPDPDCDTCESDLDCDDGNECTDDVCQEDNSCAFIPNTEPCDDGDICTENDVCGGGVCAGTEIADCGSCETAADCNDLNSCTDDTCVDNACVYTANDANTCDDNDACTLNVCSNGVCLSNPITCSDGNECTDDVCTDGVCSNPVNDSNSCSDGDVCTSGDVCDNGVCVGVEEAKQWHVVHTTQTDADLTSALLSVQQVSNGDVYMVGKDAEDGTGPVFLRYDGTTWTRIPVTPGGVQLDNVDLWWLHEVQADDIWLVGQNRTVVRYQPSTGEFTSMADEVGPGIETFFGVWGLSSNDVWLVGGTATGGILMRWDGSSITQIDLLAEFPPPDAVSQLFKVWGTAPDNVHIVGLAGRMTEWDGTDFTLRLTGSFNTVFTVSGTADGSDVYGVGGGGASQAAEVWKLDFGLDQWVDVTPDDPDARQMNGVHIGANGDGFAAGVQSQTMRLSAAGEWELEDNGLGLGAQFDFHAVFVDECGNAWAVGGDLVNQPATFGMIAYYGADNPTGPIVPGQ